MKEKTSQEQAAAARQVELLVNALNGAASDGHWLNVAGKERPKIYPKEMTLSPFNSLIIAMHSDSGGYSTSLYTSFNDARKRGETVLKDERSVPMNWYRWDKYVNRHDDSNVISKEEYQKLSPDQQKLFKGLRQREIRSLFNLEQTNFQYSESETFEKLKQQYGGITARGNILAEERQIRSTVNHLRKQINDNLIPIRRSTTGVSFYDSGKDAVYLPDQKYYEEYHDYIQDMMRQVVSATGHRERQAREGMVMRGGMAQEDALKYEQLISELASGVKMMELGLPAKLHPDSVKHLEYWSAELRENPCMIDAVESDLNNAIDIIRKAEEGVRVELRGNANRDKTQEYLEKNRPQVSSTESLVLLDILAHGGMEINERNFIDRDDYNAFMEKFGFRYNHERMISSLEEARHGSQDPELIDIAYTQANNESMMINSKAMEMLPREWELKYPHTIVDSLADTPNKQRKTFIVVQDKKTGITDVILPGAARQGGDVVLPNGSKRNFWLTPDEVLLPEERKEVGARIVTHNLPGMNKDKIRAALMSSGASYVRFFANEGHLAYRPDDGYFVGKDVWSANLNGKEIIEQSRFNVAQAAQLATEVRFERIQMIKDDNGKWALLLKPVKEPSFCVYPDKEDTNRFFSTVRQKDQTAANFIRNELAQKYHALANANPELKKDLFGIAPEGIDLSQIERVNIFKAKDGATYLCLPKIAGVENLHPREVSREQWQRLWIADDVATYKTALAAALFADVLKQKEVAAGIENDKNAVDKGVVDPNRAIYDDIKSKSPDSIVLFRHEADIYTYMDEAERIATVLDYASEKQQIEFDATKMVIMPELNTSTDNGSMKIKELNEFFNVKICDMLDHQDMSSEIVQSQCDKDNVDHEIRTGIKR